MFKKILLTYVVLIAIVHTSFATNLLSSTTRNLISYNGQGASGTLSFSTDRMYSKFCNNVSQGYTYNNNTITSDGMVMSTMMYCEGLPMIVENNFTISTGGTSSILSGDRLTITTATKNIFTFKKENTDQIMCTMQYEPVCGEVEVKCIQAPCNPVRQIFSNSCVASASKAKNITQGECSTDKPIVGSDRDKYGCISSAGYSRDRSLQQCIRPWELTDKIISRAFDADITKYNTEKEFMGEKNITRVHAAKMFVKFLKTYNPSAIKNTTNCRFRDTRSVDTELTAYINQSCQYELLRGYKGNFMPNNLLTREQVKIIFSRIVSSETLRDIFYTNDNHDIITRYELISLMKSAIDIRDDKNKN